VPREYKEGPEDDRQDKGGRNRLDELVASFNQYRERLDGRYRRVAITVVSINVLTIVCASLAFMLYQGQRWEQTQDACNRTNQQTEATIGLLRDLGADNEVIRFAEVRYPHVPPLAHRTPEGGVRRGEAPDYSGPMTCKDYANERVKGPKL
jgi:hypothetical protein